MHVFRDKILRLIMTDVLAKYNSLDNPIFEFKSKANSQKLYGQIEDELAESFDVEEITDPNEDVSFGYWLKKAGQEWLLRLSIVGKYAFLIRLDTDPKELVIDDNQIISANEKKILNILADNQIQILSKEILSYPLPISLFNCSKEEAAVYQALFVDLDFFPWEE